MISINNAGIEGVEKLYCLDSDFSWNKVTYINSVHYDIVRDEYYSTFSKLRLGLVYLKQDDEYEIIALFSNVTDLKVKGLGGRYNQVLGFEIIDKIKDGWEKTQRYIVSDYENGIIGFSCENITIETIRRPEVHVFIP